MIGVEQAGRDDVDRHTGEQWGGRMQVLN